MALSGISTVPPLLPRYIYW